MKVRIKFGVIGKYGKLVAGQELDVDAEYAGMLIETGSGVVVEEKKPKNNKAAKPKSNK